MRAMFVLAPLSLAALLPAAALGDDAATPEAQQCLAKAVYFEARGEDEVSQRAVADVVINRVEHPDFPDSVCEVIQDGGEKPPCQFSWWCDGKSDDPTEPEAWEQAQSVAQEVIQEPEKDVTDGAVFFHSAGQTPAWGDEMEPVGQIGSHMYYRAPEDDEEIQQAEVTPQESPEE